MIRDRGLLGPAAISRSLARRGSWFKEKTVREHQKISSLLMFALLILSGTMCGCAGQPVAAKPASSNSGDYDFTIRVDESDRRYTIHVPPGYDGKKPAVVVIMLHGGGGTGKAAAYETGWAVKADRAGFLAIFPDAMPPEPAKRSSFARNPQLWNDGSDRFYPNQKAVNDIRFLSALLDDLASRFTIDPKRVFVSGFSNGASMSFLAGAQLSNRIAAIAPVAGACWLESPVLEHPVPMIYITGTTDPLNPIEGGVPKLATGAGDHVRAKPKPPVRESILKWAEALGCPMKPKSISDINGVRIETFTPCRDGAEVVYITVDGLGHTWAGGRSLLPELMVGRQSDKIKATDVIWAFFEKHPKSK